MVNSKTRDETRLTRLTALRHQIHAHPELAFQEHRTSGLVAERLEAMHLEVHRGLGGTGVVATLRRGNGPAVGLRADMDALPIAEAGNAPHRSKYQGVMHACGHDGHTVMLLGAAEMLVETDDVAGTIHFIFQPAEENAGGGRAMVEDGLFDLFPCDAVFALHNWPGLETGRVAVQPGPMMASFDTFTIRMTGYGGHAAMPDKVRDPIIASAALILALQTIVSRKSDPLEPAVLSVTQISGGETFNVIPDHVDLKGTVRCFSPEVRNLIRTQISKIAAAIADAHEVEAEITYTEGYPSTINAGPEALLAAEVARSVVGSDCVVTKFRPSMASEDFSFMLQRVPGAYIWLGAGTDAAPLHNPHYDFNDELLITGSDLLSRLAAGYLKQHQT